MSALLFPGQGSQIVGMRSEYYNNYQILKKIFKQADDKLNKLLSKWTNSCLVEWKIINNQKVAFL